MNRIPTQPGLCECGCGLPTTIAKQTVRRLGYVKGEPVRFIRGHGRRGLRLGTLVERLEQHHVLTEAGCWEWTAARASNGYGRLELAGPAGRTTRAVHRLAYELFVGPIPKGLDLDHLCRNRACFNPSHLDPVTRLENARRGIKGVLTTHCPHGHPYDEENTIVKASGWRACRACTRAWHRRNATRRPRPDLP